MAKSTNDSSNKESKSERSNARLDSEVEDTFPASDPPSMTSPITTSGQHSEGAADPSGLPADFKDNKAAQFEYGRRSQQKTQHFDTSSRRLEMGNPDVGDVDLGTIEAEEPAQADDNDPFDEPADDKGGGFDEQSTENGRV